MDKLVWVAFLTISALQRFLVDPNVDSCMLKPEQQTKRQLSEGETGERRKHLKRLDTHVQEAEKQTSSRVRAAEVEAHEASEGDRAAPIGPWKQNANMVLLLHQFCI